MASSQHTLEKNPLPHSYSSRDWNKYERCDLKWASTSAGQQQDQEKEQAVINPWSSTNKDMTIGNLNKDTICTTPCGNLTLPGLPLDLPNGTVKPACKNREVGSKPSPPCPEWEWGSLQLCASRPGWQEHTSHTKSVWGSSRTQKQGCQHDHGKCCLIDPFPSKVKACLLPP